MTLISLTFVCSQELNKRQTQKDLEHAMLPPTPWVYAGAGVQTPEQHPEDACRADPPAAPDRAHQPAGVQQAQGEGAQTQTRHGGPTAAQEPQGNVKVVGCNSLKRGLVGAIA